MVKRIWKFLKRIVWGKDLVVYRLRKALRKLYEGYPTHQYTGYIQQAIGFKEGIQVLEEDKIIKKKGFDSNGNVVHRITTDGLRLVELWNTKRLNLIVLILVILQILIVIDLKFFF